MKGATMGKPNGNASGTGMHDGWQLHSQGFGFMRTEAGENLVAFADLVQWLMAARETHRAGAVRSILEGITADALPAIYFTSRDDPAQSFAEFEASPWARFAPDTPSRFQMEIRSAQGGADLQAWRSLPKAERQAELLRERVALELATLHDSQAWQEEATSRGAGVAILASKAGELWGYGLAPQLSPADAQPSNWPELVAYRKRNPGGPWTPDMVELLAAAKAARGTGAAAALAGELGISITAVNAALKRSRKWQPASIAGRVFRVAGSAK